MKKLIAILLTFVLIFSFAACSGNGGGKDTPKEKTTAASGDTTDASADTSDTTQSAPTTAAPAATAAPDTKLKDGDVSEGKDSPPTILNTMEYTLYTNIFYNQQGDEYVGQEVTKRGTFATINDRFNDKTRYYVWGYNDATKCCDWQWELVLKDEKNVPVDGSLITVTGTFEKDTEALDGYWITGASITVEEEYKDKGFDVDLTTMGSTLERVQMINIQNYQDDFEGKSICLYGRVLNPASIQNPYYDGSWSQDFKTDDEVPAIGTCVILSGTYTGGLVDNAKVAETTDY